MATNEPLNSAVDEVAAAEAELKAAQEKLEAAKAKLAAESSDGEGDGAEGAADEGAEGAEGACLVEEVTVATVVVDEETDEVEAVIVEDVAVPVCDAEPERGDEAEGEAASPSEPETAADPAPAQQDASQPESQPASQPASQPEWVPYSTAQPPAYSAPAQQQAPAPAATYPADAPVPPAGASHATGAPAQPAPGYYAPPAYGQPQQQAPHAGPGAVPPQQPYYGYQQPYYQQPYGSQVVATKDHVAAGLLAIFLGAFGIHKFYLGYNTAGFIMLAVTIIGGLLTVTLASWVIWIIAVIEGILYLTKSQTEFEQIYVLNKREWF